MQYNPIKRFNIIPRFATGHIITWEMDQSYPLEADYNFSIEVADDPAFSSLVYSLDAGKNLFCVDDSNDKQSWSYDRYYRVKLVHNTKTIEYSNTLMFGTQPSTLHKFRMAAEITRKELLRMKRYTGLDGWLLKRKSVGKVTSKFVDEVSGIPIADTTQEFGTGLDGGYYPPIAMIATYEASEQRKAFAQGGFGVTDDVSVKFRTIGFPLIEVRDIIVNIEDDARYNVLDVDAIVFPGTTLIMIQSITAKKLPSTDTVYKISTPLKHEFIIL